MIPQKVKVIREQLPDVAHSALDVIKSVYRIRNINSIETIMSGTEENKMTQFDLFDAYYKITEVSDNMPVLFGNTKECAICVYESKLEGWSIWLIRMAKDLLETDIKASIMADFSLPFVDDDNNVSAAKSLLYDEIPDLSSLHPIAQHLVGEDMEAGMSPDDILEKRGAVLVKEFLGFTPDHVAMIYPDLFVEKQIEIDGVESTFVDFNFGIIV